MPHTEITPSIQKEISVKLDLQEFKNGIILKNYCKLSILKSGCNKVLEKLNVFVLNIQEILHTPLNI